jgi:hypothetical protein
MSRSEEHDPGHLRLQVRKLKAALEDSLLALHREKALRVQLQAKQDGSESVSTQSVDSDSDHLCEAASQTTPAATAHFSANTEPEPACAQADVLAIHAGTNTPII